MDLMNTFTLFYMKQINKLKRLDIWTHQNMVGVSDVVTIFHLQENIDIKSINLSMFHVE